VGGGQGRVGDQKNGSSILPLYRNKLLGGTWKKSIGNNEEKSKDQTGKLVT